MKVIRQMPNYTPCGIEEVIVILKSLNVQSQKERAVYIYTMEYYLTLKKEGNLTFCNCMDAPGEHYAK